MFVSGGTALQQGHTPQKIWRQISKHMRSILTKQRNQGLSRTTADLTCNRKEGFLNHDRYLYFFKSKPQFPFTVHYITTAQTHENLSLQTFSNRLLPNLQHVIPFYSERMDRHILPFTMYHVTNTHAKGRQCDKKNNTTFVLWNFSKKKIIKNHTSELLTSNYKVIHANMMVLLP